MTNLLQIKDNETNEYKTVRVTTYTVDYNKVWGSSIKNMEGSTRATLIGIIPVISTTTFPLSQQGANLVVKLLNQGYLSVRFLDSGSGTMQDEQFTASDITMDMFRENNREYNQVSFKLESVDTQGVIS